MQLLLKQIGNHPAAQPGPCHSRRRLTIRSVASLHVILFAVLLSSSSDARCQSFLSPAMIAAAGQPLPEVVAPSPGAVLSAAGTLPNVAAGASPVPAAGSELTSTPLIVPAPEAEISANPGRPTVASPATLSPLGHVQIESGLALASNSAEFDWRIAAEQVMRVTVHPRLELILGAEPAALTMQAGANAMNEGDLSGGAQVVLVEGKGLRPTAAVSYSHVLRGGSASDLDVGSSKQSALLLVSLDAGRFHVDANGIFSEQTDGRVRRGQIGQAVCVSHPLTARLGLAGEIWHFSQPLTRGNALGNLWAVSYSVNPRLVLDAGVSHGLTSSSTHWEIASGFTYVPARGLWGFARR